MKDIDITLFADEDEEYGKENAKLSLKIYIIILLVCVSVSLLLVCVEKIFILRGAYILENRQYFFGAAAGFVFSLGIYGVFGKKIILKHTEKKYKEYASVSFDYTSKNYNIFWKIVSKICAVLMCAFAILLSFVSVNDIGFYDDHIKESFALSGESYDYEDVSIFLIEGQYTDEGYTLYTGNNYVLEYGNDVFYYFAEFEKGSEQDEFIKDLSKRINKQIIHCTDESMLN